VLLASVVVFVVALLVLVVANESDSLTIGAVAGLVAYIAMAGFFGSLLYIAWRMIRRPGKTDRA
jgi:hypothetical protein